LRFRSEPKGSWCAGAEAAAYACGEAEAGVTVDTIATAVAYACAQAITNAQAICQSAGKAGACAVSKASVKAVAEAQAIAFAEAYAEAKTLCGCEVDVASTALAIKKILVVAAAKSYGAVCVKGNAHLMLLLKYCGAFVQATCGYSISGMSMTFFSDGCSYFPTLAKSI
jgi:hypothetical protein